MENVYKHTGWKDWENGLFYENISLLLNQIARPNAGTPRAPFKQEVCFSIQSGNNQLSQASETILVADRNAGHKVHWYSRL